MATRPDTAKAAAAAAQEAAQEMQERQASQSRLQDQYRQESLAGMTSEQREAMAAAREAAQHPVTAEDMALRRRLADPEIQVEGTEFGNMEANTALVERYRNARRKTPGVDSARDRLNPQVDKYSPSKNTNDWESADAVARFNDVGPGRTVIFARRPEIYRDEMNEVDELMYDIPEAKVVTRKSDGKPLYSRDMVAISIPKDYKRAHDQAGVEDYWEWNDLVRSGNQHGSVVHPTESDEQAAAIAARNRSVQLGVGREGNSPTAGLPLSVAENLIPMEEMLAMEARARSGNRHHSYEEAAEQRKSAAVGRKTFGGLTGPADKRGLTTGDRNAQARLAALPGGKR